MTDCFDLKCSYKLVEFKEEKKANVELLTCSSLDKITLVVSIGLGLKPLDWKHM